MLSLAIAANFFSFALGTLLFCGQLWAAELPSPIAQALRQSRMPEEAVSLLVRRVDGSQPLVSLNAETPRSPASVMKLVTSLVALQVLGPTYTWKTEIYALGSINNGVLEGDLVIKGYGDPYLLTDDVWRMLRELRRTGLTKITGNLIVDETYFQIPDRDPGAFDGETFKPYNVLPSALLVNFKSIELELRPVGNNLHIATDPPLSSLQIENDLQVSDASCTRRNRSISVRVPDAMAADRLLLSGRYSTRCAPLILNRAAMTHATYALGIFTSLWRDLGGEFNGTVRSAAKPTNARLLLSFDSDALADVIRPMNKFSNNVMTRNLLLTLGAETQGEPGTPEKGAKAIADYLISLGLDPSPVIVDNGSGLSRSERLTARVLSELLVRAWQSSYMPEFVSSLSLSGLDGTTRRRFRNGIEAGKMHLKTGRLNGAVGLAGYVHAQSGAKYVMIGLVNHPRAHQGAGDPVLNALARWTYSQ